MHFFMPVSETLQYSLPTQNVSKLFTWSANAK